MNEYLTNQFDISTLEYERNFWNSLRGKEYNPMIIAKGKIQNSDTYRLPESASGKFETYLKNESLFRRIGTVIRVGVGDHKILAKDCDDIAEWVAEGESIPIYDGIRDFTVNGIDSHKLASFVKFDEEFVRDATFNFNDHLLRRFARVMGKAEEWGFLVGNGIKQPHGLLHPDCGAEVGATAAAISYDDILDLYFALEPDYRDHASWIMSDETALCLRNLKNSDGNYLWNHSDSTLLGKPVMISNYMPAAADGAMPVLFGDFSYYWVICRRPVSIRTMIEQFAVYDQIGYLGIEFLDGWLVRRKAVKGIRISR